MTEAELMLKTPDILSEVTAQYAKFLMNAGIGNIGVLREVLKGDFWTRIIFGKMFQNERRL